MAEVIDTLDIDDWDILSDDGWHPLTHIHKTIKYDVWELKTETHTLKCADTHIVITKFREEVFVKYLNVGDIIITDTGEEKVLSVTKLDTDPVNMYDVSVDSEDHTLFTNGILSHNSTTASVYLLHYLIFNTDKNVAIMANKESAAKEVLRRVKGAYEMLPLWMQQGVVEWNKTSIELENGMRMSASTTSPDSISGDTIALLYMDEFAKVPPHLADEFITSTLPVVSSGEESKVILVSTPKGMNHFYEYWKMAVDGQNGYIPIKVNWWEHPKRDKAWKSRTLKKMNNDVEKFNQEYGNRFLGSNSTLVDPDVLEQTMYKIPIDSKWNDLLKIYEHPNSASMYIMGVDTAKGTGRDYSVVQVLKINDEKSVEQVAIYRDNKISPHDFAQVCIGISKFYNHAYMMIENNGIGDSLCSSIWYEYEYDYIINAENRGLGVTSSKKSKLQANLLVKRYFDNEYLKIVDNTTIAELARYVEVSPNIFKSESTQGHDDTVTALLWALYFITTDFFDGRALEVKTLDDQYDLSETGPIMFLPT